MKHAKKLLALALVFAMALALAIPAFAAEGDITVGGITVPALPEISGSGTDNATHTYTVYQIFKGEYDGDLLTKVEWGSGVNGQTVVEALAGTGYTGALTALGGTAAPNPFAGITYDPNRPNISADAVARALAKMELDKDSLEARAFAQVIDTCITGDGTVVPEDGSVALESAGFYLTVDEMTTVEGQTGARNLYVLAMRDEGSYTPEAKVDVPKLDKQVLETNDAAGSTQWSNTQADYDIDDQVPFVLSGTVSERYADFKVYKYVFHDTLSDGLTLNGDTVVVYIDGTEVTDGYTTEKGDHSLTVSFADLKKVQSVTVRPDSVIRVLYTATLNSNAAVGGNGNTNTAYLEFSNDPNSTDEGNPPTGNTPKDVVTVFTFKLVANKVDEDGEALSGAGFTLYKKYAAGKAPEGAVPFAEGSSYYKVGGEITGVTTFEFKGLDAGDYMLSETTVPPTYNKAEDMYFTITATYKGTDPDEVDTLTVGPVKDGEGENAKVITDAQNNETVTFTPDTTAGSLTTDIENLQGLRLPSTGGIGTTIFYVVGGLLLVGAAVVLIAKKRMGAAE